MLASKRCAASVGSLHECAHVQLLDLVPLRFSSWLFASWSSCLRGVLFLLFFHRPDRPRRIAASPERRDAL